MKINPGINPANLQTTENSSLRNASKLEKLKANERVRDVKSDVSKHSSTEISSRAKEMALAKDVATNASDVREARIAELKERIANKEYNVKPEDIADRIVSEHMQSNGIG